MRMRFEAITRSPASSSILVIAPVIFRRVASGLMIEKVRVAAMTGRSPVGALEGIRAPPSRGGYSEQASGLLLPLAVELRPIAALDAVPASKQLPRQPGRLEAGRIEQEEGALIRQCCIAPLAVGDQDVARHIGGVGVRRQQDRLARVIGAA